MVCIKISPLLLAGCLGVARAVYTTTIVIAANGEVCPAPTGLAPYNTAPANTPVVGMYTTTNSAGSVIVYSSTSPPGSQGYLVPYTYTNAGGQVFVTASTSYGPVATGTYSSPEAARQAPCPAGVTQPYQDSNGGFYEIFCLTDLHNHNLPSPNATSFVDCMAACDEYVPTTSGTFAGLSCVGVTYTELNPAAGNCFLKACIDDVTYGYGGVATAIMGSMTLSATTTTSSTTMALSATTTTSSTSMALSASAMTSSTSTSTTTITTTTTTTTSTLASSTPTNIYPCPEAAGTNFTNADNCVYQIYCDTGFEAPQNTPLATSVQPSFEACMGACANTTNCTALAYTGSIYSTVTNCFLSGAGYINASAPGVCGAVLVYSPTTTAPASNPTNPLQYTAPTPNNVSFDATYNVVSNGNFSTNLSGNPTNWYLINQQPNTSYNVISPASSSSNPVGNALNLSITDAIMQPATNVTVTTGVGYNFYFAARQLTNTGCIIQAGTPRKNGAFMPPIYLNYSGSNGAFTNYLYQWYFTASDAVDSLAPAGQVDTVLQFFVQCQGNTNPAIVQIADVSLGSPYNSGIGYCTPGDGNTYINSVGQKFQTHCNLDLSGGPFTTPCVASNMTDCMERCGGTSGCMGITFVPSLTSGNCYFKAGYINPTIQQLEYDSALVIN